MDDDSLAEARSLLIRPERALELSGKGAFPFDAEALERDSGRFVGFVGLTARRTAAEAALNLYESGLAGRLGLDR